MMNFVVEVDLPVRILVTILVVYSLVSVTKNYLSINKEVEEQ